MEANGRHLRGMSFHLTLILVGTISGCADPQYRTQQNIRNARIHYSSHSYLRREGQSLAHLKALDDVRKSLGVRRDEHLKNRLGAVPRHEQVRAERLRETRPVRHEKIRSIARGKPETMPHTWANMVY